MQYRHYKIDNWTIDRDGSFLGNDDDFDSFEKPAAAEDLSDIWIECINDGQITLTKSVLEEQTKEGKFRCPMCGEIPRRIGRIQ